MTFTLNLHWDRIRVVLLLRIPIGHVKKSARYIGLRQIQMLNALLVQHEHQIATTPTTQTTHQCYNIISDIMR